MLVMLLKYVHVHLLGETERLFMKKSDKYE